jgi:hypothetical protein
MWPLRVQRCARSWYGAPVVTWVRPVVLALLILAVLPTSALADHAGPLGGQWHLDDSFPSGGQTTSADSSGHGLDATSPTGIDIAADGRFGNALSPLHLGVLKPPTSPLLQPQRLTLLGWVKRSGSPGTLKYIAGQGDNGGTCTASSYALYTGVFAGDGLSFYVLQPSGFAVFSPNAGNAIWDGQWHMVAGVYDGAAVRLFVDGVEVGTGTPAPDVTINYAISGNQFYIDGYPVSACGNGDFTGGIDEVRVYRRALSPTELGRLAAAPGPAPPELVPDGGGEPPTSVPRVTALAPAKPLGAGGPAVITAKLAGDVSRLEWNLKGSSAPELVSSAEQSSLRLRPIAKGPFTVEVRAVGPGGTSAPVTQTFTPPTAKLSGVAAKVEKQLAKADPVWAAGTEAGLLGRAAFKNCAIRSNMRAGPLEIEGCLDPIEKLEDIPAAERGIAQTLALRLLLSGGRDSSLGLRMMGKVLELTDGYLARGPITVNGVTLTPADGAAVLVYPQADAIVSSNARLSVGQLKLDNQRDFTLDTTLRGGQIALGAFPRIPSSLPRIGGFKLAGDVKVNLLPASGSAPAEAQITASLQLPEFLKRGGVEFQSQVKLRATAAQGLIVDNLTIGPLNADVGALAVDDFRIDYTRAIDEWRGQGRACVIGGTCLDMVPPNGQIVIRNGSLSFAGASLAFPPPGIPLFPGVALDRIGFGFGLDPTRLVGNAKVTALKIYEIDGRLVLAFPSAATPYVFARDEVGNGFPANFYGRTHTQPIVGISADASVTVPVVGSVKLGNGYFLYEYPGYVAFGGSVQQGFAGIITFEGGFAGEFNTGNGRFNLSGRVRTCIVDVICRGAFGLISSRGLAGCVELGPVNIGAGVRYSPFSVSIWPLDGCKWSPFAEPNVRGAARAAQAGEPYVVQVRRGDPSRAIRLDGVDAAPRVRVTGPGGQSLESSAGAGVETGGALRIIRSEQEKLVVVGLQDPRPGTYRIEQLPGSPSVAKLTQASDPPDAKASAKVRGRGTTRVLAYDVRRRPAQRVTFVEIAADGGSKTIGTVDGGGRGTLRFTPAPGRGKRRVEARFELSGLPAEQRTVARFAPPSARLGKPGRLRVRRHGTTLRVSWAKVPGAARYEVVATPSDGAQRTRTTRGRSAAIKGIATSSSGAVTVRAVAQLRHGRPTRARFARTARRKTRFGPLARCKTSKARIVCKAKQR